MSLTRNVYAFLEKTSRLIGGYDMGRINKTGPIVFK